MDVSLNNWLRPLPEKRVNWKQARVIGADRTSDPIQGAGSAINAETEDLRASVLELTGGKGVDAALDTVGARCSSQPCAPPVSANGRWLSQAREIPVSVLAWSTCITIPDVCLEWDSYAVTLQQVAEIREERRHGFETGVLKPPPIEIVPFEKMSTRIAG